MMDFQIKGAFMGTRVSVVLAHRPAESSVTGPRVRSTIGKRATGAVRAHSGFGR